MGNGEIRYAVGKRAGSTAKVGTPGKDALEVGRWVRMPSEEALDRGLCWEVACSSDRDDDDVHGDTLGGDAPTAWAWVPDPPKAMANAMSKKPDVSLIPYFGWLGVIRALEAGNSPVKGYERDDWKPGQKNERSAREHANAVIRHTMRYLDGEILDPETGLPHLDHAATRAMMGREVDTATMRKDFGK